MLKGTWQQLPAISFLSASKRPVQNNCIVP